MAGIGTPVGMMALVYVPVEPSDTQTCLIGDGNGKCITFSSASDAIAAGQAAGHPNAIAIPIIA